VSIGANHIVGPINLTVKPSNVILITGPSGCGKSTLLKTIAGIIPELYSGYMVNGEIKIFGKDPRRARSEGIITYVPQDISNFFVGYSLRDELVALNIDPPRKLDEVLRYSEIIDKPFDEMSDGERYRALLLIALAQGAKVLLLDEPSSHLDSYFLEQGLRLIRGIALETKTAVIIADHSISKLKNLVDDIITIDSDSCDENSYSNYYYSDPGEVVISVKNVWFGYSNETVLRNVNLEVREKEIVVIFGKNGSGKSTLLKLIAGVLKPWMGTVKVSGKIFYIAQTPIYWFSEESVIKEVKKNIKLFGLKDFSPSSALIKFNLVNKDHINPYSLSVGEARRLSLLLADLAKADIVLIDEPTLGLDRCSRKLLIELIRKFSEDGKAVVVATHDSSLSMIGHKAYELSDGLLISKTLGDS
jgi:energy-coupling factor transport system ATP-binding protein